ncbi:MAG: hypothetical protein ACF8LL_05595 [Phycisphaerales bacterium]
MHTDTLTTDSLLDDILDPSMSAPAICRAHAITLAQLIEFLEGPEFQQLTQATHLLSESRTRLLALDIAPRAMQALDQSTESDEESRLLNETIRKSASKLLTIARQSTAATHRPQQTRGDGTRPTDTPHHASSPGHPGKVSPRSGDGGGLPSNQQHPHTPVPAHASSPGHPGEVSPRSGDGGGLESNLPPPARPAQALAAAAGSIHPPRPPTNGNSYRTAPLDHLLPS